MSRKFQQDPGSLYSDFNKILAKEPENDRPVYDNSAAGKMEWSEVCKCGLWFLEEVMGKGGIGDVDVEWIEEIRIAMEDIVSNLTKEELKVNSCDAGKIISGKRNWRAPGPDRITIFLWKKACVCYNRKTGTTGDEKCRMCRKPTESVSHILAGCGALAQTTYLLRHNNALKILFFEVIRSLDLLSAVGPWYSKTQPKPIYENERAIAYWDIPLYAEW